MATETKSIIVKGAGETEVAKAQKAGWRVVRRGFGPNVGEAEVFLERDKKAAAKKKATVTKKVTKKKPAAKKPAPKKAAPKKKKATKKKVTSKKLLTKKKRKR